MTANFETNSDTKMMTREYADLKQVEIDTAIVDILPEINLWNDILLDAASSSYGQDALVELEKIKEEATKSLDARWSNLMGHYMHVSGNWRFPSLIAQGNSFEVRMEDAEAFMVALSDGFQVLDDELGRPRVGLSFAVGNARFNTPALQGYATLSAFAEPSQVSMMYVSPDEKAVNMDSSKQFIDQLVLLDRLLTLHYADDNSELFKQTRSKQQKFFTSMTDRLNTTLLSPLNGDRAHCSEVDVPYIWERSQTENGLMWLKRVPEDESQHLSITGTIESVEILEAIGSSSRSGSLRHVGDLIDPHAGPCLLVKVIESNAGSVLDGKEVFIPVRQVDNLPIAVY